MFPEFIQEEMHAESVELDKKNIEWQMNIHKALCAIDSTLERLCQVIENRLSQATVEAIIEGLRSSKVTVPDEKEK